MRYQNPQHNYQPDDAQKWTEKKIRNQIDLYGRPQVVHAHSENESCTSECKIYPNMTDPPQIWLQFQKLFKKL